MRAGNRSENRDQHDEDRASRQCIAKKLKANIAREVRRHDAGADDGRDKHCRADKLGGETARQIKYSHHPAFADVDVEPSIWPMSLSFADSASDPMLFMGKEVKAATRLRR